MSRIYYQVCMFKDQYNKHHVRSFLYDEEGRIIDVRERQVPQKIVKKFLKAAKPHCYKCFANITFVNVGPPSPSDILALQSNILSEDPSYYGPAPAN